MRWFGDPLYNPPLNKKANYIKALYEQYKAIPNFERSYKFLQDHIEDIIKATLMVQNDKLKSVELQNLLQEYIKEKSEIHSTMLPILNKRFITVEKSFKGNFTLRETVDVPNIVFTFLSLNQRQTQKAIEQSIVKVLTMETELYTNIRKKIFSKKQGLFRKQISGLRAPFSFRNVITPITTEHDYDEIQIPWSTLITAFEPHIINLLLQAGYNYRDIPLRLNKAVHNFDPEIHKLVMDAVHASEDQCVWLTQLRNPAQGEYGTLLVKCKWFKTNPTDKTVSTSVMTVTFQQGDMDGDELNYKILLDKKMKKFYECFKPENCVTSGKEPGEMFGKISLTKPVNATISNRIRHERKHLQDT